MSIDEHRRHERLGVGRRKPVAFHQALFIIALHTYSSEQNVDTALDPRSEQDAVSLLSARLGWRNERYSVTLWGENLTDETVMTAAGPQTIFGNLPGHGGLQIYLNEPRTYGVTMDVRF